jgi:hypothetical protein
MRRCLAAAMGSVLLATVFVCSSLAYDDLDARNELLRKFLISQEWGESGEKKAVWLMTFNSSYWEKVAVVIGYADNMSACRSLKKALDAQQSREYICDFVR